MEHTLPVQADALDSFRCPANPELFEGKKGFHNYSDGLCIHCGVHMSVGQSMAGVESLRCPKNNSTGNLGYHVWTIGENQEHRCFHCGLLKPVSAKPYEVRPAADEPSALRLIDEKMDLIQRVVLDACCAWLECQNVRYITHSQRDVSESERKAFALQMRRSVGLILRMKG